MKLYEIIEGKNGLYSSNLEVKCLNHRKFSQDNNI